MPYKQEFRYLYAMNAYYMWFTMVDAIRSGSVALSRELSAILTARQSRYDSHLTQPKSIFS